MELIEKFGMDKENPQVSELPLVIREKVYKDVKELLPEVDEYLAEHGEAVAIKSDEWPVTYMFSSKNDNVIALITIYNQEGKRESVLTFNFPRNEMDKLLED